VPSTVWHEAAENRPRLGITDIRDEAVAAAGVGAEVEVEVGVTAAGTRGESRHIDPPAVSRGRPAPIAPDGAR
jgi:hypothetical protein